MLDKRYLNLNRIFYLGIFLLPSAPSIGALLLFYSNLITSFKRKNSYFKDSWNLPFLAMGILMLLSCLILTFTFNPISVPIYLQNFVDEYDKKLLWIGLFNWLPYFWLFWSFQYFTFNPAQRKKTGRILLYGSVPVLLTGIAQYFFKINGPFILFNGLITWYLKPVANYDGLSGLFSNANYTGTWLTIIWPFSLVFFLEKKETLVEKWISFAFLALVFICTIFTFSRNAWIGLIIGFGITLGINSYKYIMPTLLSLSIPVITSIGLIPSKSLTQISRQIIPSIFWNYKFANIDLSTFSSFGRFEIWTFAIQLIIEKPIWGSGSNSFPILYELATNEYKSHSHNLFLELGISFGVITSLLLAAGTLSLIILSYKKEIFSSEISHNRDCSKYEIAWRSSLILICISQLFDIQYFDLRIAIVFWLLLSGLRNFIR